jgi:hypothetical protein
LHVPAEILHHGAELVGILQRHAALVMQLAVAEEMIEAQRADAEHIPFAQVRDRHGLVGDRDTAQPLRMPAQRIEHRGIVAAVGAALHQPAADKAQRVEHVQVFLQRRVRWRVAPRLRVGKPRARTEHMGMGVAGLRRRRNFGAHGRQRAGTGGDHGCEAFS